MNFLKKNLNTGNSSLDPPLPLGEGDKYNKINILGKLSFCCCTMNNDLVRSALTSGKCTLGPRKGRINYIFHGWGLAATFLDDL